MENKECKLLPKMGVILLISLILTFSFCQANEDEENLKTYIVFVTKPEGELSVQFKDLDSWYQSFLPVTASSSNQQRMVFAYRNVVTGFAAKLTAQEAKAMEEKEGFVSARLEKLLTLHTTHTPSFLGLQQNSGLWKDSNYGKGVIIGVVDGGIAPDHPSFSDNGMPPPPAKWKGKCEFNGTACNNKLIGARNFIFNSTFTRDGHGTHTASTAAGSPVPGANFYGQVNGTAMGIAPLAHLAMYKVCKTFDCPDSAVLAAMDAAIEDGVDVLSLSLGDSSVPFFDDVIAIGAYGAIQKGIFVSCAAGNYGPSNIANDAPWILTVGASTVDREVRATVLLGNKTELDGQSLFQPKDFPPILLRLVYAGANGNASSARCLPGSLKNVDVKGKVVLCEAGGTFPRGNIIKSQEVKDNGGAAMILMNDVHTNYVVTASNSMLPASHVSYKAGLAIKAYINSTSSPMATIIFKGTVTGVVEAPQVALFSSRGPSHASPGILKPDVIGPGVSILAAWPFSMDNSNNSKASFNIISGTSMACPHLSGIAALLKSVHPDWSPAAIKSAIVTTTDLLNLGGKPITDEQFVVATVFDIGAGHVNASRASDPGLVYDVQPDDYIPYLCGLNYSNKEVGLIVQRTVNCSNYLSIPEAQLNYPSFSIQLGFSSQTYTRTVTNVGDPNSTYIHEIVAPEGVDVVVTPNVISFSGVNQKATYSVTFSRSWNASENFAQGYITWKFGWHSVRSPIAILFK